MKKKSAKRTYLQISLSALLLAVIVLVLFLINGNSTKYIITITRLCAINVVLALSMNLVQGFTGIFSLGHAGFMAIGAYTVALLTIPVKKKATMFMLEPLWEPLQKLNLPFGWALIIGGLLAAAAAFLIGLPCLRLRGDYLAIATLGFSEIIRILITNAQGLTNGAQGLKSIPATADIWWCYGIALATIVFMALFISSSHGRALKAIREDEIAAESMGIPLLKSKLMSFMISAFLAGVGGGLYASYIRTIGPDVFQISRTYDILMIVVMGGMGSISGSVVAAFIVTIGQEWLRVLDGPIDIGAWHVTDGISGMRMVIFSLLLLIVILFFRNGLLGNKELSWTYAFTVGKKLKDKVSKIGAKNVDAGQKETLAEVKQDDQ